MDNETFTYRFDLDRDYFINVGMTYQSCLPFITLLTIRPLIFMILMRKRDYMAHDIRWGYIVNQFAMTIQEFNFCFLFRVHDLAPYAGLYCDGPICRMGIDKQYLMGLLAMSTIGTVPTFLFLLLRMHQLIIASTQSLLKLSTRTQFVIVLFLTGALAMNVAGFYAFGKDCANAEELIEVPDLAWLRRRGGTIFLFGPSGQSEFFGQEVLLFFCSFMVIAPLIAVATIHSVLTMRKQNKILTSRTQHHQRRISRVFFLQLLGVNIFYILPLFLMLSHMVIDFSRLFHPLIMLISRCTLIIIKAAFLERSMANPSEANLSVQQYKPKTLPNTIRCKTSPT